MSDEVLENTNIRHTSTLAEVPILTLLITEFGTYRIICAFCGTLMLHNADITWEIPSGVNAMSRQQDNFDDMVFLLAAVNDKYHAIMIGLGGTASVQRLSGD